MIDESDDQYRVVVNEKGQYSVLLIERAVPPGWSDVGKAGRKTECLSYIREVWTDIRPLSVRRPL
jgi:MbtH protein